jgi:hypothetical protein
MHPPTAMEEDRVKDAILRLLRSRNDEITLEELVDGLAGYDLIEIKRAVWPLMSEQAVEMTTRRNLRVTKSASQ